MIRSARKRLLAVLLAGLASTGCRDSAPEIYAPGPPGGRIQGTVRAVGLEPRASVLATRADTPADSHPVFETTVQPGGTYTMDVPAGRYVLTLRTRDGASIAYDPAAADSLPKILAVDAAHSPVIADFDLATAHIHVTFAVPVPNASGSVRLHRRGRAAMGSPIVGSDAHRVENGALEAQIAGILPGSYRAEMIVGERSTCCEWWYEGEHLWLPGVRDSAASPWIELRAGDVKEITGSIGAPAHVQGRIGGAWIELGLPPPTLAYFAPDSTLFRDPRAVAADGSFDHPLYVPGPVKLLVQHDGIDQWVGGADFATATPFSPLAGQTLGGVQFLECGLYVQVRAPATWVGSVTFHLVDALSQASVALLQAPGDDALWAIPNLRPGAYRLRIEPYRFGRAPWIAQWFDRAASAAAARTITIGSPGEIVGLTAILETGGTISGRILDSAGRSAYYSIEVTPVDDRQVWGTAYTTSSEPTFVVEGIPDGDWKLGVQRDVTYAPPEPQLWYPGVADWSAAQVISIRDHQDVTGIDFRLPPLEP